MGTGAIAAGPQVPVGGHERIPGITFADLEDIVVNPYQPRREFDETAIEELAQSIKTNGIIQPLVVRKGTYGYQLIAGERRLRAAKKAGLKMVPIVVRKSTDREALEIALVENIQRQNLNCIDESLAYVQLMQDFHLTQEEVADRVGKERSTVANFMRLLKLPAAVIEDLKTGLLSFGHGKALLGLEEQEQRLQARLRIIDGKLSVRATESLIEEMKKRVAIPAADGSTGNAAGVEPTPLVTRLNSISSDLTKKFGVKAEIKGTDRKGKIVLSYRKREELDRLIELLQN